MDLYLGHLSLYSLRGQIALKAHTHEEEEEKERRRVQLTVCVQQQQLAELKFETDI